MGHTKFKRQAACLLSPGDPGAESLSDTDTAAPPNAQNDSHANAQTDSHANALTNSNGHTDTRAKTIPTGKEAAPANPHSDLYAPAHDHTHTDRSSDRV